MKKIAIVTGASGGLGEEFVKALAKEEVDEVWAIARRKEKLEEIAALCGDKVIPFPLDLTKDESYEAIEKRIIEEEASIKWMVNNAGMGRSLCFKNENVDYMKKSIDLNVKAVTILSFIALNHMEKGSYLLNVGSQAGWQPVPYETTYAATKAYVNNFTMNLYYEYKSKGIHVMLVSPYWIEDAMLREMDHGKDVKLKMVSTPNEVVVYAMKAAKKKKMVAMNKRGVRTMNFAQRFVSTDYAVGTWLKTAKKLVDIDN